MWKVSWFCFSTLKCDLETSPLQVILFLIMLIMRKRVALTIALFHVAGKVFIHLPLLVFQPFWTFFVLILFWTYWITVLLFLGTTGKQSLTLNNFHFIVVWFAAELMKKPVGISKKKAHLLCFYSCLLHCLQVIVHLSPNSQHSTLCVRLAFWFDTYQMACCKPWDTNNKTAIAIFQIIPSNFSHTS